MSTHCQLWGGLGGAAGYHHPSPRSSEGGGGGVAPDAFSVHGDSSDPPVDGGLLFWVISAQTHLPHPAGSSLSEGGQRVP